MKIKFPFLILLITSTFILCNCTNNKSDDPNLIKVGVSSGPELKLAEVVKKIALKKYGLTVELISFSDYVIHNEALSHGDIDVNAFQHQPYLDEQSKQRGYKLVSVGKTFIYPIAAYSKKIKQISQLLNESTIAIPNDPTNGGRALLLLQKAGLIGLKEGTGILPKVIDIISNPKKILIIELEAPQLTRALEDETVSLAIINNTFSSQIGLSPAKDGLLVEDKDSPYVNLIVARQDNRNSEKIKKFVQAFQSIEAETAATEIFNGGAIKGW